VERIKFSSIWVVHPSPKRRPSCDRCAQTMTPSQCKTSVVSRVSTPTPSVSHPTAWSQCVLLGPATSIGTMRTNAGQNTCTTSRKSMRKATVEHLFSPTTKTESPESSASSLVSAQSERFLLPSMPSSCAMREVTPKTIRPTSKMSPFRTSSTRAASSERVENPVLTLPESQTVKSISIGNPNGSLHRSLAPLGNPSLSHQSSAQKTAALKVKIPYFSRSRKQPSHLTNSTNPRSSIFVGRQPSQTTFWESLREEPLSKTFNGWRSNWRLKKRERSSPQALDQRWTSLEPARKPR
jgi:hypothetical protein